MRLSRLSFLSAACLLVASGAYAHTENSQGFSTVRVSGSRVSYDLFLDYFELARVVQLDARRDTSPSGLQDALRSARQALGAYLDKRLQISLDGVGCRGAVRETLVERRLDRDYARLRLEFSCPGAHAGVVRAKYDLLFDDSDSSHRNVVTYDANGKHGQGVFSVVERELQLGQASVPRQALRFVELGIHHILGAYDHVLFVVALLLSTTRLLSIVPLLSLFTVAHSLTLAAALLGLAQFPAAVVEPLIALSIACVAVESLSASRSESGSAARFFATSSRFRLAIVFAFGLVHGMGFGGALRIGGVEGWGLAVPLVSFNLGIELGQGLLVLAVFPLLVWLRRRPYSPLAIGLAQGAISIVGLVWYFERLLS